MPRLLLIADTHIPGRARRIPDDVLRAADAVDLIVHAGDWVSVDVLDELSGVGPVLGVWGNNDGPELRERLPEVAHRTIAGIRLGVVHETGPARGRETRMDAAHPDVDVLVFGHSHIPWDSTTSRGTRLLNPGSPTDRRRQPHHTMMFVDIDDGRILAVDLVTVSGRR